MIVVDVETSGTEPQIHSILSIGAVDTLHPERRFSAECRIWKGAKYEDEAFAINGFSLEKIQDPEKPEEGKIVADFIDWAMRSDSDHTLAGHNPSFDRDFLRAAAKRSHINWPFPYRTFDLLTLSYMHLVQKGEPIPQVNGHIGLNSNACHALCGLPPEPNPHLAMNGALWEAESIHRLLYGKKLLPEFAKYPIPWLG